ncbi:MAG: RluA family pseudouridine synthase [Verrucomicrobia bacterium]|nr:RluA family pseudouridine synthase [Verrucomicrobiota bacterium]
MSAVIKLSSPATREFWEIPVLFEDEHWLALNKPPCLLTSPDRCAPDRPNLMQLLHQAISEGKPWTRERGLSYLMNAHRLDFETSGVILLAKTKPMLVALANLFGSEKPVRTYLALVQGAPEQESFEVEAPLAPHPARPGLMHIDRNHGKKAKTLFEVAEKFTGYTLLQCRPLTGRPHQIRVHLQSVHLPIAGDEPYRGRPLLLSYLKRNYRLKNDRIERPLISTAALHAERLEIHHPVTGQPVSMTAEWPKDLRVAVKYLRRYAGPAQSDEVVE